MPYVFIGIDPGQSGGIALIKPDETAVYPWEDANFVILVNIINNARWDAIAYVEKVSAMPGNGVVSMFKFGKSAGFIEGVLAGLRIPYQLIPPQKWKSEFSLGSDKAKSIEVCERLFPNVNLLRTDKCKKKHDGMAEALLIAEYARRMTGRNSGSLSRD